MTRERTAVYYDEKQKGTYERSPGLAVDIYDNYLLTHTDVIKR